MGNSIPPVGVGGMATALAGRRRELPGSARRRTQPEQPVAADPVAGTPYADPGTPDPEPQTESAFLTALLAADLPATPAAPEAQRASEWEPPESEFRLTDRTV